MDAFREDEAMNNNVCIFYTVAWIFLGTVLAGCDSGGSAGASAEKWLEAPDAQNNYGIGANIRALESRSGPADTSCEGIIGEVRESIKNPGEHVTGMQVIVAPCNQAGLQFGNEARCMDGRLQVMCQ